MYVMLQSKYQLLMKCIEDSQLDEDLKKPLMINFDIKVNMIKSNAQKINIKK